jgi:hypothetical protein
MLISWRSKLHVSKWNNMYTMYTHATRKCTGVLYVLLGVRGFCSPSPPQASVLSPFWLRSIFIPVHVFRPPLWYNGQSSWLQIQRPGFDSRCYQIFWEVAGLERGPLSLVSTIEELLGRKSSGSGLEIREYGRKDPPRWPLDIPLSAIVGTNFADKLRSLSRYNSLAE